MPIGAHVSIAGGVYEAAPRARAVGCEVAQIFTKNSNQWAAKPLTVDDIARFKQSQLDAGVPVLLAHDSYLINLCAPKGSDLLARSEAAFREEIERCEALGIPYLVTHPGAHGGAGEAEGIRRMAALIDRVHDATRGFATKVLLENTAGQGSVIGYRFEHLREILDRVKAPERLGVCLDTCHAFAAGYDLRTAEGYARVMEEFDHVVGLDRLRAFHLNDSKKGLGARVDRHEHIGRGEIGLQGFRALLNDARVKDRPMVLETAKGEEGGVDLDVINLTTLRRLRGERVPDPRPAAGTAKAAAAPARSSKSVQAKPGANKKPAAKTGPGRRARSPQD